MSVPHSRAGAPRALSLSPMAGVGLMLALMAQAAHAQPVRLSFAEAMLRALRHNPDALVATEEIARSFALVEQVRAASLPSLSATGTLTQLDSARLSQATPPAVILPATGFNAVGAVALGLDPRRWVLWSQAAQNEKVARRSASDVNRRIATTVGQVYLSVYAQRQVAQADESAVQNAAAHVEYTRARLEAGNGTLLDFQRATALYESERALLARAQFLLARLQEQLGLLLGETSPVDVTSEVELPAAPADPTVWLDDAWALRADVALAREQLTATTKVLRESWADFLPSASFVFQGFHQTPPTQTFPTNGWQLLLVVNVPIYDGGLRYGLLKERRALEREARIRLDAEVRLVGADVRTARVELEQARAAVHSARRAAELSAEVLRLTVASYSAGLSTNIEVIDAQLASLNNSVAAALAENDERQAQLDVLLATGRFP